MLLFNSGVKFHAKVCTYCWNINKSRTGLLFYTHRVYDNRAGAWSVTSQPPSGARCVQLYPDVCLTGVSSS